MRALRLHALAAPPLAPPPHSRLGFRAPGPAEIRRGFARRDHAAARWHTDPSEGQASVGGSPVTGVDGCRTGWVGVDCDDDGLIAARVAPTLSDLLRGTPERHVVGIDMPLGLLDTGWRTADREARALLGPRRSSIFAIPPAPVWLAPAYADANQKCRQLTGSGFSIQAWGLRRKLLEAGDYQLRCSHPLYEVHPELSFRAIAGAALHWTTRSTPRRGRPGGGACSRRRAWWSRRMKPCGGSRSTCWTRRPWRGPPGGSPPGRRRLSRTRRRPMSPAARSRSATSAVQARGAGGEGGQPRAGGTRFSYEHTGFTGLGGVFMAQLLGHVRRKMLRVGLPAVLDDLNDDGTLRPTSTLTPKLLR